MSDELDGLLALAEEEANSSQDGDSFVTCRDNVTINRTVDETFFSTATHVADDRDDFSDEDEDRNTPTFARLSNSPEERRLTLTEQETKDLAAGVSSPTTRPPPPNSHPRGLFLLDSKPVGGRSADIRLRLGQRGSLREKGAQRIGKIDREVAESRRCSEGEDLPEFEG